jgi:hypothetical protein
MYAWEEQVSLYTLHMHKQCSKHSVVLHKLEQLVYMLCMCVLGVGPMSIKVENVI